MKVLADLCRRVIGLEREADKLFVEILKDDLVQAQIID